MRLSAKGFGEAEIVSPTRIKAGAATPDKRVAALALESGIGGFHFYHGIPGGIGGALRMNAGANGVETRERVVEVRGVDRNGDIHVLSNADMGYDYRHSTAPADLDLHLRRFRGIPRGAGCDPDGDGRGAAPPRDGAADPREDRRLDLQEPAGTSAWKEIDQAGCRGLMIGGAQMSPMHCNFMINTGNATGYDLEYLGETVRARVLETSGVRLEWEIKRLGRFKPGREVDAVSRPPSVASRSSPHSGP